MNREANFTKPTHSRILTKHDDLVAFVNNYNQGSKRRNVSDLKGSFVRAFYSQEIMLGGYSLNDKFPYFYLEIIPPDQLENISQLNADEKFTEITCLWIKKEASNLLRAIIYSQSVIDAVKTKPDYVLGGTFSERYRKIQMRALPRLLYHGKVNVWNKKQVWWVFCGKPTECIARLPYAISGGWTSRMLRIVRSRICC